MAASLARFGRSASWPLNVSGYAFRQSLRTDQPNLTNWNPLYLAAFATHEESCELCHRGNSSASGGPVRSARRWALCRLSLEAMVRFFEERQGPVLLRRGRHYDFRSRLGREGGALSRPPRRRMDRCAG